MAARVSQRPTADREVVQERVFDAPRELVWEALTDPKHVVHWWGPNGFTLTIEQMDVRPGGVWRFVMHGPDGQDYKNRIEFLEVVRPERMVFVHGGEDVDVAADFRTTVTLVERGGKTRLTMLALFPSAEARERVVREHDAIEGGKQHLARLAEYLTKMARAQ